MPSVIVPVGYAHGFLRWLVAGDTEEMLSSIGLALVPGTINSHTVAQELFEAWLDAFPASSCAPEYTLVGARAYVETGSGVLVGEYDDPTVGTDSFGPLPNNCAMLIQKRTASGGRRNRGRMFIPPSHLSESSTSPAGIISTGTHTALQTAVDTFLSNIETASSQFDGAVVLHSSAPSAPTPITSLTLSQQIATQRERMRR